MNMQGTARKQKTFLGSTKILVLVAILSAISYLLSFFSIRVPLTPSFLKLDLADFPALLATFMINPVAGLFVVLIKNTLSLLTSSSAGIGQVANFLIGSALVVVAGLVFRKSQSKHKLLLSCLLGSLAMAIVAAFVNYFMLLPMYSKFMPMDSIIASCQAFFPFIKTKLHVVLFTMFPFTLIKGLIVSAISGFMYKRIAPILSK